MAESADRMRHSSSCAFTSAEPSDVSSTSGASYRSPAQSPDDLSSRDTAKLGLSETSGDSESGNNHRAEHGDDGNENRRIAPSGPPRQIRTQAALPPLRRRAGASRRAETPDRRYGPAAKRADDVTAPRRALQNRRDDEISLIEETKLGLKFALASGLRTATTSPIISGIVGCMVATLLLLLGAVLLASLVPFATRQVVRGVISKVPGEVLGAAGLYSARCETGVPTPSIARGTAAA